MTGVQTCALPIYSRRRHARNWLRDNLPAGSYKVIINTKRAIFGPHEGPYED